MIEQADFKMITPEDAGLEPWTRDFPAVFRGTSRRSRWPRRTELRAGSVCLN